MKEGGPNIKHPWWEENEGNKRMAMKTVASILGYRDIQEFIRKDRATIKAEVIKMLQDFAETSDIIEEDYETIGEKEGWGSMNVEFITLYESAITAGFIQMKDLEDIYPGVPKTE